MSRTLLEENAREYFRGLVREAMASQRMDSSEFAEFYLVTLLERFMKPEGAALHRPLALEYLESFEREPSERTETLRRVGDTSLFMAGVFLENIERQVVGAEYYVRLGGMAYGRLASDAVGAAHAAIFRELADRFRDFVGVLDSMELVGLLGSDRDVLRIYRRWLVSRGSRDAERLVRLGVLPVVPEPSGDPKRRTH